MSAVGRLGYWRPLTEAAYRERVKRRIDHGQRMIITGLVDGRLEGYLDSFAVDGVLCPEEIFIATHALRTGIGTGLYVETIEAGARAGSINVVCNGLHTPEDPDLCHFKESLGLSVDHVPAQAVIPAPIKAYIKARRRSTYYRLTGLPPGPRASDGGVEVGPADDRPRRWGQP